MAVTNLRCPLASNPTKLLARMRLDGSGDLHGRQHETARCMQHKIDGYGRRCFLDGGNDGLRVFQVDMTCNVEPEQAAFFLAMDHGDDAAAARLLDGLDGLHAIEGQPSAHQHRLQGHEGNKNPDQRREIEGHGGSEAT